VEAGLKEKVTV